MKIVLPNKLTQYCDYKYHALRTDVTNEYFPNWVRWIRIRWLITSLDFAQLACFIVLCCIVQQMWKIYSFNNKNSRKNTEFSNMEKYTFWLFWIMGCSISFSSLQFLSQVATVYVRYFYHKCFKNTWHRSDRVKRNPERENLPWGAAH